MMARRPTLAVTLAAFVLLMAGGVLTYGATSSQAQVAFSLHLLHSEPDAVIDGGKAGPSIGDLAFVKGLLYDDDETQVGAIIAQTSRFSAAGSESHLSGTITLNGRGTVI